MCKSSTRSYLLVTALMMQFTEGMGYRGNIVPGELPGYGAIFMSNSGTKKECFQRKLFGLPLAQSDFVLHVKKGMFLFLFEFEKRQLHGVFRATSNGEINIEPNAFRSSQKCFPAQVPFTCVWNCNPLAEHEFKDAIRDNYFSWKKFKFGLSKDQVYKLMTLFRSKRISRNDPPRTCLRYDDKPEERDTRYGYNRKKVRDRIKFIKKGHHGFDSDEVKEVDDQGYRTLMEERAHKDNKEVFLTNCKKEIDDFGYRGSRKLYKRLDHTLGGLRRVSDASLHFQCDRNNGNENFLVDGIAYKNKYFSHYNRVQDEYHVINDYSQNHSALNNLGNSPNRGRQKIVDGWFFRHGRVESQQKTFTDHPSSKPKGVTTGVCQNPNYEPRTSPFESRGADIGIELCSDEEFDLGNVAPNQNNSDFIPISEASEQFHHPFEFNNIENTYEGGFPNSTSCDTSMITTHTPYDPEVPDFCHKPYDPDFCHRLSNFAPGPGSSPIDSRPFYPSETIPYHPENKGSDIGNENPRSTYVRKVSVFDRLTSAHDQEHDKSDEKCELDALVNKAMKMLEKSVSSPIKRQSSFKQDDDDFITPRRSVDYELPMMESEVKLEYEGIEGDESILEETRVVDFKRRKKTRNKNFDDEFKESIDSDCQRRRLVRPVFVEKESTRDENTPLKVDCYLRTTAGESAKKLEGQKGSSIIEGEVCAQVEEDGNAESCQVWEKQPQEKCGFDDMAWVGSSKYEHKMCGWIDE